MFGDRARAYFLAKKNKNNHSQQENVSNRETSISEFEKLINTNMVYKGLAVLDDEYSTDSIYDAKATSIMFGGIGYDLHEAFESIVGAVVARQQYKKSALGDNASTQPFSYAMLYDAKKETLIGGIGVQVHNGVVTTFVMDEKKIKRNQDTLQSNDEVACQLRIDQMFK